MQQRRASRPSFETMQWQGPETNDNTGGWSGGPVFRSVEDELITRLELIGIIYQWSSWGPTVMARHADAVQADGTLRFFASNIDVDQHDPVGSS